jgi:hypothetical protein
MVGGSTNAEATLYYLYMMADGNVSYSEEKIFDEICRSLDMDQEEKDAVIQKCNDLMDTETDAFSVIVREAVDENICRTKKKGLFTNYNDVSSNCDDSNRIIWNLVNLGCADSVYSEEERKIVKYLVAKWSVSAEIYQVFIDIADTMQALATQKEWIEKTFSRGAERDKKEREIDLAMKQLREDVTLTMSESTM